VPLLAIAQLEVPPAATDETANGALIRARNVTGVIGTSATAAVSV
jgi:hypothetical protein